MLLPANLSAEEPSRDPSRHPVVLAPSEAAEVSVSGSDASIELVLLPADIASPPVHPDTMDDPRSDDDLPASDERGPTPPGD